MSTLDIVLRLYTILLFATWQIYWWVTEKRADQEKPKTSHTVNFLERHGLIVFYIPLGLQLLGWQFLPFSSFSLEVIGFLLVTVGFGISVSARRTLGANWTHAASYQIKQNHSLVTQGVYAYIRHPIYTGLLLALTGAELVAQSYLFIGLFVGMLWWGYRAGKREEKILTAHFGKQYLDYKKRTKMLIPFVF